MKRQQLFWAILTLIFASYSPGASGNYNFTISTEATNNWGLHVVLVFGTTTTEISITPIEVGSYEPTLEKSSEQEKVKEGIKAIRLAVNDCKTSDKDRGIESFENALRLLKSGRNHPLLKAAREASKEDEEYACDTYKQFFFQTTSLDEIKRLVNES